MKKILIFLLLSYFIFSTVKVFAREKGLGVTRQELPTGMENIKIGDGQVLFVPKGTRVRRVGAQIIVEDNAEYAVERFITLEERVKKIETAQEELKETITTLKDALQKITESKEAKEP